MLLATSHSTATWRYAVLFRVTRLCLMWYGFLKVCGGLPQTTGAAHLVSALASSDVFRVTATASAFSGDVLIASAIDGNAMKLQSGSNVLMEVHSLFVMCQFTCIVTVSFIGIRWKQRGTQSYTKAVCTL